MKVLDIIRDRLATTNRPSLILKEAQIIQGKITKIYPHQKAEIQIGSQTFIAEVSASLKQGNRYYFEVQGLDEAIHLKVIKEASHSSQTANIKTLLQQLGIPQTRSSKIVVEQLIKQQIPFQSQQVKLAASLLEDVGSKPEQIDIIKEMITRKLPISQDVFSAVLTQRERSLGELLSNVMTRLQEKAELNKTNELLLHRLENLLISPVSKGVQMVEQIIRANPTEETIDVFKLLQLVRPNVDVNNLIHMLTTGMDKQNLPSFHSIYTIQARSIESDMLQRDLQQLHDQSQAIKHAVLKVRDAFSSIKDGDLTPEQMKRLQQTVQSTLAPLLPSAMVSALQQMMVANDQNKLNGTLQWLSHHNHVQRIPEVLLASLKNKQHLFRNVPMDEQFLNHLKNYLDTIGIKDEFVLQGKLEQMQGLPQQDLIQQQSVKSLLLQMVGQESTVLREHAQPLIHFINGMQMQSVIEAGNLIQATLQLPSEKLGLHQDILLQFEGQKNETGNIDPDFCRIFFMLHLHHLEETIIDMHIQKRVVTLYVFNDNITTTRQKEYPLQEVLKENLLQLNYQLSEVRWQSIHQETEEVKNINPKMDPVNRQRYEGFDYRI